MDNYAEEQQKEIEKILGDLQNLTMIPGPIIQQVLRFKADLLIDDLEEEQKMIGLLVESLIPSLRLRAGMEFDEDTQNPVLNKEHLEFFKKHQLSPEKSDLDLMYDRVAEMPKEWTIVQITPFFSGEGMLGKQSLSTSGIHIVVFNCGCKNLEPFCVSLPKNYPLLSTEDIKYMKEKLKKVLSFPQEGAKYTTKQLKVYHDQKQEMRDLLESLVYDLESDWLGAWKCLLIGKYLDENLELKIKDLIDKFLKEKSLKKVSEKIKSILFQAAKGINQVESVKIQREIDEILEYCFPGKKLGNEWRIFWEEHKILTGNEDRYPLILIVDETLDSLPWEMIPTLNNHPCSRVPSLHLLYALFKAHEDTIKDGYKIISDGTNGRYILNPGLDLSKMEVRLKNFFQYWLPEWSGVAGRVPTLTEFKEFLTTSNIFCYSGHGSGAQYCPSGKIKKQKINAVVCLFGCGSTQLIEMGPEVEMYWTSQMYLLAACPCLIGMLWVVTDLDMDSLTARFLSYWIPNSKNTHWQSIKHKEWLENGKVTVENADISGNKSAIWEPDLLRALCKAKINMKHIFNRAAVVARGIPIKLMNKGNM